MLINFYDSNGISLPKKSIREYQEHERIEFDKSFSGCVVKSIF